MKESEPEREGLDPELPLDLGAKLYVFSRNLRPTFKGHRLQVEEVFIFRCFGVRKLAGTLTAGIGPF